MANSAHIHTNTVIVRVHKSGSRKGRSEKGVTNSSVPVQLKIFLLCSFHGYKYANQAASGGRQLNSPL